MTTAAYTRASTMRQVDYGVSLDDQEQRLLAQFPEATIYREEAVSGKTIFRERPQASGLWAAVEAGTVKRVVFTRLDRAFRGAVDALTTITELDRRGIEVVILSFAGGRPFNSKDPMDKALLGMLAIFSDLERDMIAQRTREAMRFLRKQGVELGTKRRYRPGQVALECIRSLTAEGWDSAAIAAQLNLDGHTTLQGQPWTDRRVREARRSLTRRRGKKD